MAHNRSGTRQPTHGPGSAPLLGSPKGDYTWSVSITKTHLLLPASPAVLTPNEQDILDLLAQGYSAKEIAAKMSMSHRTVEHRIESVKTKLGAKNVAHAVAIGSARYVTST